jgi:hypothetical protein
MPAREEPEYTDAASAGSGVFAGLKCGDDGSCAGFGKYVGLTRASTAAGEYGLSVNAGEGVVFRRVSATGGAEL